MEDFTTKYKDDSQIMAGIAKLNYLIDDHPKFKIGQEISFYYGFYGDLHGKSKILGFDKDGGIYILWDCYWFPIRDEPKRDIKLVSK